MGAGYRNIKKFSVGGAPTASNAVLIETVDISNFDRFALIYKNSASNVAFADLVVEVSSDPTTAASDSFEGQNWVQIPTATLPQPSALGANSSVITAPIDNAYRYLRVLGRTSISSAQQVLELNITGFERF